MCVIGLTGGVATGKSLVAEAFRRRGARVVSADAVVREITATGTPILKQIAAELGQEFIRQDGSLDRQSLARYVFRNEAARRKLEAIIHPPVLNRLREEIERHRNLGASGGVLVMEVPLLYEVGIADWFDSVVVVTAPEDLQVARLMARDQVSREEARARIAAQMPLAEKVARADFVVHNSGSPADVDDAVQRFLAEGVGAVGAGGGRRHGGERP